MKKENVESNEVEARRFQVKKFNIFQYIGFTFQK